MFGKNKVVVPKHFANEPENTLTITSLFYTIQGEGFYQGQANCVFIRLSYCNLQCSFCDTFFDAGDRLTFDEIFNRILSAKNDFYVKNKLDVPEGVKSNTLLVITGGEPLMQSNLTSFLHEAHKKGYRTQIESNGLIYRELPDETFLVVSPKINEKIGKHIKLDQDLFGRINSLKFVISATMEGYTDIPQFAIDWHNVPKNRNLLFVSPMNCYTKQPVKLGPNGTLEGRSEVDERISFWTPGLLDLKENQRNHEHAAFIAMKYGCRLTLQTHLYASLP